MLLKKGETNCLYWFSHVRTSMSEVSFALVLVMCGRVAWGQMHVGVSGLASFALVPLFSIVFVCVSACEQGRGGREGGWEENKHIFRCLSSASTQVRPSARWGARLCQMAAHTHTHTQTESFPDLSSNCAPHLWMRAETRDGCLCLYLTLAKNALKAVTFPTCAAVLNSVKHGVSTLAGPEGVGPSLARFKEKGNNYPYA